MTRNNWGTSPDKLRNLPTSLLVSILISVSVGYAIIAVFVLVHLWILLHAGLFGQIGLGGATALFCIAVAFLLLAAGEGLARRIAPVWPIVFGRRSGSGDEGIEMTFDELYWDDAGKVDVGMIEPGDAVYCIRCDAEGRFSVVDGVCVDLPVRFIDIGDGELHLCVASAVDPSSGAGASS